MADWQVGDLAVCIEECTWPPAGWWPRAGQTYTVSGVGLGPEGLWLDFAEDPSPTEEHGWWPERFRKIHHDKNEDCEPEFVTLLKRIKRRVDA